MTDNVKKWMDYHRQFHTVVLLDHLCCLASEHRFSLDKCDEMDAIKRLILERTGSK